MRPGLDVSSVLLDPLFVDSLLCTRNQQTVGENGVATIQTTPLPFVGIVTPASGFSLERKADGEHASGSITVITRFRLQVTATGNDADIVTWNDNNYTVVNIADYSRFGRGFVQATCELLPLIPEGDQNDE